MNKGSFHIQPAGHWIRVEPISADEEASMNSGGGIVLAGSQTGPIRTMRVVAVGPGMFHPESRQYIPLSTSVGDIILIEEAHIKSQHLGRVKVQMCAGQHVIGYVRMESSEAEASARQPTPYS